MLRFIMALQNMSDEHERAFYFASLLTWNQLIDQLRAILNPAAFKKHFKTHF